MASRFEIVSATLSAELAAPYIDGAGDCFCMGCRVADALDPSLGLAALYVGRYTTLKGAHRALRREGCKCLADLFSRHLAPCGPAEARLGDLVVMRFDSAEHVGICVGRRFVTKTERGRSDRDLGDVIAAFRVG